jgi:hypothetical protein
MEVPLIASRRCIIDSTHRFFVFRVVVPCIILMVNIIIVFLQLRLVSMSC